MSPLVEVQDIQQQISRAFDIAGGFTTSVAPNVSPIIQVGPGAPAPFGSDFTFARGDSVTGDATHPGLYGVVNPSTSSQWIVVDEVWLCAQAAAQNFQFDIYYGQDPGAAAIELSFAATIPAVDTDTRQRATSQSPLTSTNRIFLSAALTPVGLGHTIVLGTVRGIADTWFPARIATPVILVPNTGLFWGGTVNASTWITQVRGRVFEVRQK